MAIEVELGTRIEQIVLRRLTGDKLNLPSPPVAAAKCLQLLQQPDPPLKQIATTLAKDPILSVQVMRAVGSAANASAGGIRSLDQAVTRLGAQRIRTIVVEASARKLFDSRDPRIIELARGVWDHSLAVALLARDLSALVGSNIDGEVVYLAGLLHDVGKPVLAGMFLEAERMLTRLRPTASWFSADTLLGAIQGRHRAVGAAIAERWGLPGEVVAGIRDMNDFDAGDRHCPANFVRFANAVAKLRNLAVGPVDKDDCEALIMVGRSMLGIDDDVLQRLAGELAGRVKATLEAS